MLLFALPLLAAGLASGAATAPTDLLQQEILQADARLFAAAFEQCDAAKAASMTTQDMEFFHDQGGKSASNRAEFEHSIATLCADQQAGNRPLLRRALLDATVQVFPMEGDRALEMGTHHFYQHRRGGPETLTGEARFVHLWRKVGGQWQLERVISYDHHAVER